MKRIITIVLILAALGAVAYIGIRLIGQRQQESQLSNLQTTTANRGGLTATIGATGTVHAKQTALLTWQTTGTVDAYTIQEGNWVEAGQILVSLDPDSLPQSIILARADLINAQNALDDLLNNQSVAAQALQALLNAQQVVYIAERAMDRFEGDAYKDDLDDARQDVIDRQDDLAEAQDNFEPYQDWDPTNTTRQRYEQELIDAQNAYDEAVRKVALLELDQQLAQANLDAANAALDAAQREYDRLRNGPNPDDVTVLESRIAAAQATLDLAQLAAPFAGTVTLINNLPGDLVTPGMTALRLDDLSQMEVDVQVTEIDINRVRDGQSVNLTFDAILDRQYSGVVTQVSQVGNIVQGVVQYTVTVELTDADEMVRPGMTAAVNIIVEQLEDVLLVPNRAVRLLDGNRVVYILENGQLNPVRIRLGATSDTYSEVLDGELQVGDQIVLNPPQLLIENNGPRFMR
jgi:HlyD family secretion protein